MAKTKTTPEVLKPYIFHGVDLDTDGTKEVSGDCPFCGKESHFNVNRKTGLFRCLVCDASGNPATFIARLHEDSLAATKDRDLEGLAKDRNLPVWVLKRWRVALSIITGEVLVPAYNLKGKLANLFRYCEYQGRMALMSTPGCKLHPFGGHLVNKHQKTQKTIHWLEGPWDGMAMDVALASVRRSGKKLVRTANRKKSLLDVEGVLATPGANIFQADWLDYTKGKACRVVFDNDHPRKTPKKQTIRPGFDGQKRLVKVIQKDGRAPRSLFLTYWGPEGHDPDRPDGFDFRDLVKTEGPLKALGTVQRLQKRVKVATTGTTTSGPKLDPIPRSSFTDLLEDYRTAGLHITQPLQDTLAVMLATVVSTTLDGDQIWFRVIGPPGSGKSTLAEAIGADSDHCLNLSLVTGFHSGYNVGKEDASLISQMKNRTALWKDADTLLTAPNRDKILAELRDLFDRTARARYRNRVANEYDEVSTTFILCGTDSLRKMNRSFLGERFLDVEILGDADRTPYLDRAAQNTYQKLVRSLRPQEDKPAENEVKEDTILKQTTMGLIRHFKDGLAAGTLPIPTMSQTAESELKGMGQFISYMRARLDQDDDGLNHRPRIELATRLVSQMVKLGFTLAIVLGKKTVDQEVLRICRKVVCDTAEGYRFDIVRLLYPYRTGGLTAKALEVELHIPDTSVRRMLNELRQFNVLQRDRQPNRSGQRGRNLHVWQLTPALRKLYRLALKPTKEEGKAR